MPGPYAIEGAGVFVPARIAAGLERALKLDVYRINVRGADRELDEVLLAWHASAARWVDGQREQGNFRVDGSSVDDLRKLPDRWTSMEVAARSRCTARAVTFAANAGRLVGERINGRWQFKPEDVAQWVAARKR